MMRHNEVIITLKVIALISCVNTLTSVLESPSPVPPTPPSENNSPPRNAGDNLESMRASMYYSMAEYPKTEQHTPLAAPQEVTGSMKRLRRMATFGSSSRMLVAAAQLLDAQLSIDHVELTLNSRGDNFTDTFYLFV